MSLTCIQASLTHLKAKTTLQMPVSQSPCPPLKSSMRRFKHMNMKFKLNSKGSNEIQKLKYQLTNIFECLIHLSCFCIKGNFGKSCHKMLVFFSSQTISYEMYFLMQAILFLTTVSFGCANHQVHLCINCCFFFNKFLF